MSVTSSILKPMANGLVGSGLWPRRLRKGGSHPDAVSIVPGVVENLPGMRPCGGARAMVLSPCAHGPRGYFRVISSRQGGLSGVFYICLAPGGQNHDFKMILSPVAEFSQSASPWELTATHFGSGTVFVGRPKTNTSVTRHLK